MLNQLVMFACASQQHGDEEAGADEDAVETLSPEAQTQWEVRPRCRCSCLSMPWAQEGMAGLWGV